MATNLPGHPNYFKDTDCSLIYMNAPYLYLNIVTYDTPILRTFTDARGNSNTVQVPQITLDFFKEAKWVGWAKLAVVVFLMMIVSFMRRRQKCGYIEAT